jgi:Raf kinase inhibitor-like YbhB/YbcL family protein
MSRGHVAGAAAGLAALALAAPLGCGGDDTVKGPPPAAPAAIRLSSSAFSDGALIPRRFTCDGGDVSPPLAWEGVPAAARSLALLVEDPDAPGGTFVHWTLFNLPPTTRALDAGRVPAGAREGKNSFGHRGYGGPCPPKHKPPHRYVFTLYALRSDLGLDAGASPDDVRAAIGRRALARGQLTGRYGR